MPTESLKSFLDRDLSKAHARESIEIASPLLQELVNYATNVFVRCDQSASGGIDEDSAPFTLYRQLIGLIDGVEALIRDCCTEAAIPLLRSSFESLLYLEYILEDKNEYAKRSLSWFLWYVHELLDFYERIDDSTPKGKEFKKIFEDDKDLSYMSLPSIDEVRKKRKKIEGILSKSHIQPIELEYQLQKSQKN